MIVLCINLFWKNKKKIKKKKKEKHYFERVNILLFDMVSNGISLFFKKFLIFTRVATL